MMSGTANSSAPNASPGVTKLKSLLLLCLRGPCCQVGGQDDSEFLAVHDLDVVDSIAEAAASDLVLEIADLLELGIAQAARIDE